MTIAVRWVVAYATVWDTVAVYGSTWKSGRLRSRPSRPTAGQDYAIPALTTLLPVPPPWWFSAGCAYAQLAVRRLTVVPQCCPRTAPSRSRT